MGEWRLTILKHAVSGKDVCRVGDDLTGCTHWISENNTFYEIKAIVRYEENKDDVAIILEATPLVGFGLLWKKN